jgi:anti-sigma factor RsiW
MDCAQIQKLLADHAVGLLRGRRARAVSQHLAACSACAKELRALQRTAELIELTPAAAPPDDLWAGLSRRLADERVTRVQPRLANLWLRPAVALAAVLLVALGLWRPWSGDLPPTPPAVASSYVQVHLAGAPTDMLGAETSRGLLLATAGETDR